MSKKTIAIIEAMGNIGSVIAKSLAKGNYRLILFALETRKLSSLLKDIKNQTPTADINCIGCEADASWEADVIISTISLNNKIAIKIKPFVNRKILISISSGQLISSKPVNETKELQKLLPGAKVVKLFYTPFLRDEIGGVGLIAGNDEEALQMAKEILKIAGIDQLQSINYSDTLKKII